MSTEEYRESRKLAFESAQTLTDRVKIESIRTDAAQSFYRVFGKRLSPLMVARGIENILLSDSATISIKSALRMLPQSDDRAGWDRLAKSIAASDSWLSANLVSSDEKLKDELKAECLAGMSPTKQMTLYRAGTLDSVVKSYVDSNIDQRLESLR